MMYMRSGTNSKKWGGIRDHTAGISSTVRGSGIWFSDIKRRPQNSEIAGTFRSGTKPYAIQSAELAALQNVDPFLEFKVTIFILCCLFSTLIAFCRLTC